MTTPEPPRFWEGLLRLALPWQRRDEILGDLREGFARRSVGDSGGSARWYRGQVLRSIPAALALRYRMRRDSTSGQDMNLFHQDLRFALRSLRKSPGFAVVATLTLAMAIAVNTSVFSIISAIVFADLPMQDHETSAMIRAVNPELGIEQGSLSPADFLDLQERTGSFSSLSALTEVEWVLTGEERPERVSGILMTAGTTESWRLPPVLGRSFTSDEAGPAGEGVVMLSHGYWQSRFGGDPEVLGRTLVLDGRERTVVGVMSPKFEFASFRHAEVIAPLRLDGQQASRTDRSLFVTARLEPGVTHDVAAEEVRSIGVQLEGEHPEVNAGWSLRSAAAKDSLLNSNGRRMMLMLQLTVAMVIVIACANVANMLLARATTRAREMAVRTAMGAGRGRLVRQLLTEGMVLSVAAGGLGLALAYGLNEALVYISAGAEEAFLMAEIDGRVLAFTLAVALVAPVVFGLFPALRASSTGPIAALRGGRSTTGSTRGGRARGVLVTAQVSLALCLMIVAGLLTRSVVNLQDSSLGYELDDLLTVRVDLPGNRYEEERASTRFFREAVDVLGTLPEVEAVTLASTLPGIEPPVRRAVEIEGVDAVEGRSAPSVGVVSAGPQLFDVLGLTLLSGRGLTDADDGEGVRAAVVSRVVADRFWKGDALGRRFRLAGTEEWIEVVGVVSDVGRGREMDDRGSASNVYVPHAQAGSAGMYLLVRSPAESAGASPIRQALWQMDPDLPIGPIRTMERAEYERSGANYAILALFGVFAVAALVMSVVGIYGVMSYSVSQRRKEIGVRMALGAEQAGVRWLIVTQGSKLVAGGLIIGIGLSLLMSRILDSMVFGIAATDPVTFLGVSGVLATVALVATLIPATRAVRQDPAATLREG